MLGCPNRSWWLPHILDLDHCPQTRMDWGHKGDIPWVQKAGNEFQPKKGFLDTLGVCFQSGVFVPPGSSLREKGLANVALSTGVGAIVS